jgi:hypothetical protein
MTKECTCPGGGNDPKNKASWEEYRLRKAANVPVKPEVKGDGKGKGGKGPDGKGKEKGKGKGKGKGDKAKAVRDQEVARASAAVALPSFPRHCIGLDSWANVHMKHQKKHKGVQFPDVLTLAHGVCPGRREVGPKGVPRVVVEFDPEGDNIDLFPEGFLYERGCNILRGDTHTLTTPQGQVIEIKMWGTLPYITKEELQKIIADLPEHTVPGRSGLITQIPTAMRVCRNAVSMSETRANLKHLLTDMPKPQFNNVVSKYKNLPDVYYGGDITKVVSPDKLDEHLKSSGTTSVSTVKMWEWFAGSASLSHVAEEQETPHHPPIDYRHGWNLAKREHQLKLLKCLVTRGTDCLFASPNCAPWGNDSRAVTAQKREERREKETPTLAFLAVACIFQILLDRK